MNAKRHARLARDLITAAGGLVDASKACRLQKTQLGLFQDPNSGAFMPADVIADLEEYVGKPMYSAELAAARTTETPAADLLDEVLETTEHAVQLQAELRKALADGVLDAAERRLIDRLVSGVVNQVRDLVAASERATA